MGIYGFIFWRDSGWAEVIVDELEMVTFSVRRFVTPLLKQPCFHKSEAMGSTILRGKGCLP